MDPRVEVTTSAPPPGAGSRAVGGSAGEGPRWMMYWPGRAARRRNSTCLADEDSALGHAARDVFVQLPCLVNLNDLLYCTVVYSLL